MSPTQMSLKYLRKEGYVADVAEYWLAFRGKGRVGGVRRDLFGFVDIVALRDTIVAVQTTSRSNMSARVRKITCDPDVRDSAKAWLLAGGKIVVHGWYQRKPRSRWELRSVDVTLGDFPNLPVDHTPLPADDPGT